MVATKTKTYTRGEYGEISLSQLSERDRATVTKLVEGASKADKVDEHGTWEFGAEFDRKQRGYAINWDLYGIARDKHSKRVLALIQIRKYEKAHKNWYPSIRKSYFLLGRNEDDTIFAHSVESRVIHAAIRKDVCPVKAVQDWIFQADYEKVIRQGDMALVPCKRPSKKDEVIEVDPPVTFQKSHVLTGDRLIKNGVNYYVLNPHMHHIPETHPDISGEGWYKILIGKRADYWSFAAPTID